jgi:hypothetical protein
MLALLVVTLLSVGTLSWCPSPCFADEIQNVSLDDNTDRQLAELRDGLLDAFKGRDIERMLTFVTPDVIVTWQNAEVSHGTEELRAFIERMIVGPESVVSEVDGAPLVEGRKIYENQIISYGRMNDAFTLRGTGQKFPFDSRFSALIVRENGRLLLSGLHLSVNAFDNPILSGQVGVFKMGAIGASLAALLVGVLLGRRFGRKI